MKSLDQKKFTFIATVTAYRLVLLLSDLYLWMRLYGSRSFTVLIPSCQDKRFTP